MYYATVPVIALFRSIESLYEELVREGVIVKYPKVKMAEYEGEYKCVQCTCMYVCMYANLISFRVERCTIKNISVLYL